jgi:transposase
MTFAAAGLALVGAALTGCRIERPCQPSVDRSGLSALLSSRLDDACHSARHTARPHPLETKSGSAALRHGGRARRLVRLIDICGHNPRDYLKDVLTRMPSAKAADLSDLLPHRWKPA